MAPLAAALLLAGGAWAQEGPRAAPPPVGSGPGGDEPPPVELDRLLELPSSLDYSVPTRGGDTPGEWRARFQRLRADLEAERTALAEAQVRLEERAASSDAWQVAPPIPGATAATNPDAPLDFQLRQEIRRHEEEIAHLEREIRKLGIEADLAGVPPEWRE